MFHVACFMLHVNNYSTNLKNKKTTPQGLFLLFAIIGLPQIPNFLI